MKMRAQDGHLFAEVTLRDVLERTDVSDMPMLSEIKRLYDENDKLRERVGELEELTDGKLYIPQEWYAQLKTEDAKLRELVNDLYFDLLGEMPESMLEDRRLQMQELGIEAEG